jgi:putative SOS response-associated peptidase YedK
MCNHYDSVQESHRLSTYFGVDSDIVIPSTSMWPRQPGVFIRAGHDLAVGRWGLIPPQTSAAYLPKAERLPTFNARSETIEQRFSFRHAWSHHQRCIVPAEAIYEPDWRSGHAVSTRIWRTDGAPMGIAGIWDHYRDLSGQWQLSFTLLTVNADQHPLFRQYHAPGKEKRMVVILQNDDYEHWLSGSSALADLLDYPDAELSSAPAAVMPQ